MSNDFKIVGENNETNERSTNKNKKTLLIIIFCLLLLSSGIALFVINKNKVPDDYELYQQKAQIYEEQGIEYTYEDYKQDEKALEEQEKQKEQTNKEEDQEKQDTNSVDGNNSNNQDGQNDSNDESSIAQNNLLISNNENVSEATKQLLNKNEEFLEELEEDTMVETNLQSISASIISQTKTMNQFISDHLGYPDSKYNSEYDGAKNYIDEIVKSMYGKANPEPMYGLSLSQIQAEARYSISEGIQYNIGNGYTQYKNVLNKWTSIGHPTIDSIETISLSTPDSEKMYDDTYLCNLIATLVSGGVKYKVYLSSQIVDGGDSYYKILDIERI